jgi:hypothetical protein
VEQGRDRRTAGDDIADAYCLPGSFESRRWSTRWIHDEDDVLADPDLVTR